MQENDSKILVMPPIRNSPGITNGNSINNPTVSKNGKSEWWESRIFAYIVILAGFATILGFFLNPISTRIENMDARLYKIQGDVEYIRGRIDSGTPKNQHKEDD